MPELPEVETVMRGLAARMSGRRIVRAHLARADLRWALPQRLASRLTGAEVLGFRRRAKYILMRLAGGESVLIHLGMSGRLLVQKDSEATALNGVEALRHRHEHLTLLTDDGWRISLIDPRRFGCLDLLPTAAEDRHRLLAGLGPEPLEDAFSPEYLEKALNGRTMSLKAALMDQRLVAGLGNIYACEALYRAELSPRRRAGTVRGARAERLVAAIKATLTEAIAAGGSSLRDYVQPNGALGYFQHAWKVYGHAGEPCPRCPGPPACRGIRRLVQSARSSFYCPQIQR